MGSMQSIHSGNNGCARTVEPVVYKLCERLWVGVTDQPYPNPARLYDSVVLEPIDCLAIIMRPKVLFSINDWTPVEGQELGNYRIEEEWSEETFEHLLSAAEYIDKQFTKGKNVFICSFSDHVILTSVLLFYCNRYGMMNFNDAYAFIKEKYPVAEISPEHRRGLVRNMKVWTAEERAKFKCERVQRIRENV